MLKLKNYIKNDRQAIMGILPGSHPGDMLILAFQPQFKGASQGALRLLLPCELPPGRSVFRREG